MQATAFACKVCLPASCSSALNVQHVTGQLLAQKITRKGKVILRELDLAARQMQAVGDG
ncbi:Uncharacterised protein [Chlamydia trachomatis]|nr:Uncharacterised protein [Chlamydia trachomatis]